MWREGLLPLPGGQRLDKEERTTFDVTLGRQFVRDTLQTW